MINKVLYLGPKGSYTSLAVDKFLISVLSNLFCTNCELLYLDSIYSVFKTLETSGSESVVAVLPIENSIEGVVRETQDNLACLVKQGFRILAETQIPIEHSLIGYGEKKDVKTLLSHPQAFAQCREYIYNNFKTEIVLSPTLSTSKAISLLNGEDKTTAAIGNKFCAEMYSVPIIETRINDEKNNVTRFILLSKQKPFKSAQSKVSIIFSTKNEAGALNKVLCVLEKHGLNMSYIDSRPSRKELGEYVFYVDFTGYIEDGNVVQALLEIQPLVSMFEVLSEGAICV